MNTKEFKKIVWDYFKINRRAFPWRETINPYFILVSEVMLQQTQVNRVISKYTEFISRFPTVDNLAKADKTEVLKVWQGMGYNRRAMYLYESAKIIINKHKSVVPNSVEDLDDLPGIGYATASSICAFAFNTPTVFIETNIRSVFIHFFFENKTDIADKEIITLVEKTLDKKNPRQWYFALMDYGTYLKKTERNPNRKSKHYARQSKFEGSNRQLRGQILKLKLVNPKITSSKIAQVLNISLEKIKDIVIRLSNEELI
ncbi:MAG: A/G-specific adenine glycosylase [Patescibacteria group bacterium]